MKKEFRYFVVVLTRPILAIAAFVFCMGSSSLLAGENDFSVTVTAEAAVVSVFFIVVLYFFNQLGNMDPVQLSFYRRKFILSNLIIFTLISSISLLHFDPQYYSRSQGNDVELDNIIIFLVYIPSIIIAYIKVWRCPKCDVGLSLKIGAMMRHRRYSLGELFRMPRKLRPSYTPKKDQLVTQCSSCEVLLVYTPVEKLSRTQKRRTRRQAVKLAKKGR